MNNSKSAMFVLLAVAASGFDCGGRVEKDNPARASPSPVPSVAPAPQQGPTFVIQLADGNPTTSELNSGDVLRMSFDLTRPLKESAPPVLSQDSWDFAKYEGSDDYQVRFLTRYDGADRCSREGRDNLEEMVNTRAISHDVADVSSVRLEFEHMIPDVDPRGQTPGVCVGVHSKESGWTWDLTLRQPTLDTPWVFGGANGTAHLDLSLDAKKIDMVAVVGSGRFSPQYSVRRIRYVASPLAH